MCEQGWMPTIADEATYAAGTLIDNVLIPKAWERKLLGAYTMRGFSDKDHRTVCTTLKWDTRTAGWERPVGSVGHQLTEEQVEKLDALLQEVGTQLMEGEGAREQYRTLAEKIKPKPHTVPNWGLEFCLADKITDLVTHTRS